MPMDFGLLNARNRRDERHLVQYTPPDSKAFPCLCRISENDGLVVGLGSGFGEAATVSYSLQVRGWMSVSSGSLGVLWAFEDY